jgi:NhaP-type Na+/H+ or K+/H+ antiporter
VEFEHPSLTIAIALAAGVVAQSVSKQVKLPGIIALLAVGAALGPEGLGWVQPRGLGDGLFILVELGVAVILFEGGLNLEWSRLRREEAAIRRLITVAALVTFAGATGAARAGLGWDWDLSALFGSLVVVTGPTVVTPLLRDMRLKPRLQTVLEAEGVFIDAIGALLATLVLQVVLLPEASAVAGELGHVASSIGLGLAAGLAVGGLTGWSLRTGWFVANRYETVFTLAFVILLFEVCNAFIEQSGILAVIVAGIVVGNIDTPVDRDLKEFKDRLTVLLIGLLFVLLAADIALDDVWALGWAGLTVVAILAFVIRPASVWVATGGAGLAPRERLFIGLVGPRGIVAAAIASITAIALDAQGMDGGSALRAMVFLTIAGTVVQAGVMARPVASLLGLRQPTRDRVAILGAQGLGLALAEELRRAGRAVVFLDADPRHCRQAEEAKFPVVFGDALEERTLLRAQVDLIGTAVGLTANEHLNRLFVREALLTHGVPRGVLAMASAKGREVPEPLQALDVDLLFEAAHDVERWDVRWRHDEVVVEHLTFTPPASGSEASAETDAEPDPDWTATRGRSHHERFVMLAVKRGDAVTPMTRGFSPEPDDLAAVAVYFPERDEALRALGEAGWQLRTDGPLGRDAPG